MATLADASASGCAEGDAGFEFAPVSLFLLDEALVVRRLNRAGRALLDVPVERAIGRPLGDFFGCELHRGGGAPSGSCAPCVSFASLLAALQAGNRFVDLPLRLRRSSDPPAEEAELVASAAAARAPSGRGMVLCIQSAGARRRTSAEQDRARKLDALGGLARRVAHDFNNHLTAILGQVAIARTQVNLAPDFAYALDSVEVAALRAADLSNQLLAFGAEGAPARARLRLAEPLRAAVEASALGARERVTVTVDDDLWPVSGDADQLRAAFQHVLVNAREASAEGGLIAVSATNLTVEDGSVPSLAGGRYVRVTVRDEGTGIAPLDLPRVVDPYFTTKKNAHGLGLTAAYAIMGRHQGHLAIESRPGHGTAVNFYLPAERPVGAAAPPRRDLGARPPADAGASRGRVLVMDDEEAVRLATTAMLDAMGWEVAAASDGREALHLYESALREGRPFAAVLLDLTVPNGMGGREAMQRLQVLDPGVRAIVTSGYNRDPVMANFWEYGFTDAIAKPYVPKELDQVVRRVLERAPTASGAAGRRSPGPKA